LFLGLNFKFFKEDIFVMTRWFRTCSEDLLELWGLAVCIDVEEVFKG
jgi:hypothetical protein